MLSTLKTKIPFLKEKTLDEYNQTVLMPSFNMMEINNNCKYLDINIKDYKQIITNSKNIHTNDTNYKIMKMINYLKKIIFDNDFLNKIIMKIIFVTNYGDYNITNKSFVGNIKLNNNNYKFGLEIDFKKITYALEYKNIKRRGILTTDKNTINIKYEKYDTIITKEKNKTFYKINNEIRFDVYNKMGIQQVSMVKHQKYHYYEDINHLKTVLKIDSDNNYTKQIYIWKCPKNTILKSIKIKYQYPKNISSIKDIDEYYIAKNISPNNNKLPNKGKFYVLDKTLFLDYCSNKCDIDTLWDEIKDYEKVKS